MSYVSFNKKKIFKSYWDDRTRRLVRVFTVCRFSLGISKSHSRMYLKWTSQKLTSFANSLSLSLSLSLSGKLFLFTLMQIWRVSFRARSCLHWLYWKNGIAPAGIERDSIPTYHETHVFATVIRSFHCFKIGSYKFLAEGGSVYWLTAYCISIYNLQARFIKNVPNPISHGPDSLKQLQLTPFW